MNYTTQKGDTLGTIAQKFLGSSTKWRDIWTANPSITNPDLIRVGQIISIPAAQPVTQAVKSPVISQSPTSVSVSDSGTDKITALLNNRSMLIILGIGLVGIAYALSKNKTRLA